VDPAVVVVMMFDEEIPTILVGDEFEIPASELDIPASELEIPANELESADDVVLDDDEHWPV